MVWYTTFDDTFFITISTILVGVIGLSIRSCYRSKCYKIELGCLKIYRDVEEEKEIDMQYHGAEEEKSADEI